MTPEGKAKLILHEGERLMPYDDTTGHMTIGIGHNLDNGISQAASRFIFAEDLAKAEAECASAFEFWPRLDEVRRDVLVNLCFNMGIFGLKTFKSMIAAIEIEDWGVAAYQLFNSRWRSQVQKQRVDDLMFALERGHWRQGD